MKERSPHTSVHLAVHRIRKELESARRTEEAAKKALTWTDLDLDIQNLLPEHADFVNGMISAGITRLRITSQHRSIAQALTILNNAGPTSFRPSSEIIETTNLLHTKIENSFKKEQKMLSDFYDRTQPEPWTDEYIDFNLEMRDTPRYLDPFDMLYYSFAEGHLPGKKTEEQRLRKNLTPEAAHERGQAFLAISHKIKEKKTHEKSLGEIEGFTYVLGESNELGGPCTTPSTLL